MSWKSYTLQIIKVFVSFVFSGQVSQPLILQPEFLNHVLYILFLVSGVEFERVLMQLNVLITHVHEVLS